MPFLGIENDDSSLFSKEIKLNIFQGLSSKIPLIVNDCLFNHEGSSQKRKNTNISLKALQTESQLNQIEQIYIDSNLNVDIKKMNAVKENQGIIII